MSKLNAGAFEFVPGKTYRMAHQPPQSSSPMQSILAPSPAEDLPLTQASHSPSINKLSVGGSKPSPPVAPTPILNSRDGSVVSVAPETPEHLGDSNVQTSTATPLMTSHANSPAPPVSSNRVFTTDKAKTDTSTIAKEVQAVADSEVLKDLYGDGMATSLFS